MQPNIKSCTSTHCDPKDGLKVNDLSLFPEFHNISVVSPDCSCWESVVRLLTKQRYHGDALQCRADLDLMLSEPGSVVLQLTEGQEQLAVAVLCKLPYTPWGWGVGPIAYASEENCSQHRISLLRALLAYSKAETEPHCFITVTSSNPSEYSDFGFKVIDQWGESDNVRYLLSLAQKGDFCDVRQEVLEFIVPPIGLEARRLGDDEIRAASELVRQFPKWGESHVDSFIGDLIRYNRQRASAAYGIFRDERLIAAGAVMQVPHDRSLWGIAWSIVDAAERGTGVGAHLIESMLRFAKEMQTATAAEHCIVLLGTSTPRPFAHQGFKTIQCCMLESEKASPQMYSYYLSRHL